MSEDVNRHVLKNRHIYILCITQCRQIVFTHLNKWSEDTDIPRWCHTDEDKTSYACVCRRIRAVILTKVISARVHAAPANGYIHWHSAMARHSLRQLAPITGERSPPHTHTPSLASQHMLSPESRSLSLVLTARCNDEEMILLNEVCLSPVLTETALLPVGHYGFSQHARNDHQCDC